MQIVIRVDSSTILGTGHVMRCLTLANLFRQFNSEVFFICRNLPGNIVEILESENYTVYTLPFMEDVRDEVLWYQSNWKIDAHETIAIINEIGIEPDLLIVDHYGLEEKWEAELSFYINKLMVIDDLANRPHSCNLILDQNFYKNLENRYDHLVPDNCKKLLGPRYVLLREEFLKSNKKHKRTGKIENILVFFGGSDPTYETIKTLNALVGLSNITINVVVGKSNSHRQKIKDFCDSHDNYYYHCQISYMAKLMIEADLAIGAGGATTWERCFLGLPSITISVAKNQVEVSEALNDFGACIYLGYYRTVKEQHIKNAVQVLINHPEKVYSLSKAALNLVESEELKTNPLINAILEDLK